MIDIEKAKKAFKEYTEKYDKNHPKVRYKIAHTYRVAENCRKIAQNLNLNKEEQELAEIIGLLHDIGRFEQIRIYNTTYDAETVDHADLGVKILFEDGEINKFVEDEKNNQIIYKSVRNHNKYQIEDGLNEKEILFSKIIRDADKLDIYNVIVEEKIEDAVAKKTEDIRTEKLSDEIFNEFMNEKLVSYKIMKSNIDHIVIWLAYIYDFNFEGAFQIIHENDYINKIIAKVDYKDTQTKERMEKIKIKANEYVKNKII